MKLLWVGSTAADFSAAAGPQIFDFDIDVLLNTIDCAGNSAGTAALVPDAGGKAHCNRIVAKWIDANNYGIMLPIGITGAPTIIVEVFAFAPNGDSITVFLPSGFSFADGSTSLSIAAGVGKAFVNMGLVSGTYIVGVK